MTRKKEKNTAYNEVATRMDNLSMVECSSTSHPQGEEKAIRGDSERGVG